MIFGIRACSGFDHAQIPSFTSQRRRCEELWIWSNSNVVTWLFLTGKFPEVSQTDPNGPPRDLGVPKRGGFSDVAEPRRSKRFSWSSFRWEHQIIGIVWICRTGSPLKIGRNAKGNWSSNHPCFSVQPLLKLQVSGIYSPNFQGVFPAKFQHDHGISTMNEDLGGGFKYFIFSPLLGEDSHFD